MAPSRRNRQLAGSSMLLNEPRRPGRFRAPRSRTNPQDEATRIAASTQLAEDFGMLPPRQIRPTYVPLPAANDDQRWMDVDQNRPENQDAYRPAILHARYHRLQRYAAIRQQRSDEWLQLVNQATATYLFCQQSSRNWTSVKFPAECVPYDCTCPPGGIHHRSVDLIGLPERHVAFQIPFCKCTSDVIRLLHYGFLASSAKKPRTAFSVGLIQFHDSLWQTSTISTASFIKGLSAFLDSRHRQPMLARGSKKPRQLGVPFSHSIDLYSKIKLAKDQLFEQGLSYSTNQKWAAQCPRCFGPNENEQKANPQEPDFIVAMDGNYQQRHYAHASKDSPIDNQYPPIFLRPSEINSSTTLCEETEVHVAGIDDPCAQSHKAADDTRDATTWDKCDDSGIFGSACRHDVPLLYANIFKTGEKLYYPVSVLRRIFTDFPKSKIGILYDIGCQLETHIKKRGFFVEKQPSLLFGTSVFHSYVHEWSCQVKYNPRLNMWWGLSDGEGLERLWSYLSPLIPSLRVSTRLHRLYAIHALSQYLAEELNESAGEWLHRKLLAAHSTIKKSQEGLENLYRLPIFNNSDGENYTNEFFQAQWDNEQAYHLETNVSFREKQEKELGRLLRMEDQLEAEWSADTFNLAEAIHRARLVSKLSQDIEVQRAKVGDPLFLINLTQTERDQLLKIWHAKTEMRQRFLALVEEKAPLVRVCRPGEQSSLGTNWQQKILGAIKKRAKQLHKVLNEYNKRVQEFSQCFPDRPRPREIEYTHLMQLDSEDSFWNDGVFTNQNEPWAVDPNTQKGIRLLASLNRGLEEQRRIGWEVRRAMKWAIREHDDLKSLISEYSGPIQQNNRFAVLIEHPILQSLTLERRILACKALVHSKFIRICRLQRLWNEHYLQVLADTANQRDDDTIRSQWSTQMATVAIDVSQIPGDNENLLAALERRLPEPVPEELQGEDDDDDDDNEDEANNENTYLNDLEEMANETMIEELATLDDV
ncbi:hypothetical protein PTTG_26958 [Puccinia triticina 1-1 BBBD Race 1]|uniref:CxC1 domain-containing protein n=1 Tax=Puccinia triticina (isolate 1-1 / race 1 (BBBD)) TaxID=630390 RepID=A0A180GNP3_PUCT1|nr:hypothetical protein PTTG_26958 [Puccinia triticina 1-1 BBBD Race 1]